jgi:hypothetical protein
MTVKRLTLAVLALLAVQVLAADLPKPEGVAEAMKKAHIGKDSPFRKLSGEKLDLKEGLTWKEIGKYAEELVPMRDLMVKAKVDEKLSGWHKGVKEYDSSLKDLQAAAKAEDRKAAKKAMANLHQSCSHCHE